MLLAAIVKIGVAVLVVVVGRDSGDIARAAERRENVKVNKVFHVFQA